MAPKPVLTSADLSPGDVQWFGTRLSEPTPAGCRLWLGARDSRGNGALRIRGYWIRARTLTWIIANGTKPSTGTRGKRLTAKCGNPLCCTIEHLHVISQHDLSIEVAARARASKVHNNGTTA